MEMSCKVYLYRFLMSEKRKNFQKLPFQASEVAASSVHFSGHNL